MTVSFWQDELKDKPVEKYDVAIIGGGIMGAGAAYWLSKRQGLTSCLLEKGKIASGASGRNAGFLLRGIHSYYNQTAKEFGRETAKAIYAFTEESVKLVGEFAAKHNTFDYDPSGSYLLASSLDELNDLNESAQMMQEDGFAVEYLEQDPLDRGYFGALSNSCDAGINPVALVRALLEAGGVKVYEDEPVISITHDKRLRVATPGRIIECDKVLLSTNAYSPLVDSWFGKFIKPIRGQVLVTQALKKKVLDRVCYANYGWEYFRQLADGRFLLGGSRQSFQDTEIGYADTVTTKVQSSLEGYLKDHFPEAGGAPIDHRWSGIMAFTQDGLPIVGELEHLPGVFYAVGCNGHGISYGLNMARLLVEMSLDGKDAGAFSAARLLTTSY